MNLARAGQRLSYARAMARLGLAGLLLIGAAGELQNANAEGDTRTLSFHHAHTKESITVTFKRNGRYDQAALKKLDWFMRDWRKNKDIKMDPHLFDLMWEVYREVGATAPIDIICGYRSPETNAMLRARSSGVARTSQHTEGHAIDFYIPGVPLAKIRAIGLRLQRGGVGFYPTSGSPFVHLDTGSIRHWPRIARADLIKIFPDGRTVHIPSDGQPLKNYALALADVERRGDAPNSVSLASAREAGAISEREERAAKQPNLLAALFGGGTAADKDEDSASEMPAPKQARAPLVLASLSAKTEASKPGVPMPYARPKFTTLAAIKQQPAVTAAVASIFDERGYWRGVIETGPPVVPAVARIPFEIASINAPVTTGSAGDIFAYAAETGIGAKTLAKQAAKAAPMGTRLPLLSAAALDDGASSNTAAPAQSALASTMAIGGQRWDSPWLRAAVLTPSVTHSMRTTRLGAADPHWLRSLMVKPSQSLVMTFSDDPNLGMVAGRFGGDAVVFLATATFTTTTTASLR